VRVIEVEQGTGPWLQTRVGRITSSRMADVMTRPKLTKNGTTRGGITELAGRRTYRAELVCERLTGVPSEHHVTRPMQWGIDNEPFARTAYEVGEDVMVDTVGFVLHPTMDFCGASPDGIVGKDGCLEIKCPTSENFLDWRDFGGVPEEHIPQMQWVMACCEREWCDFVAFDPRMPQGLRFLVRRMYRDEKRIAEMEFEVIHFHEEIEQKRLNLSPGHIWAPHMPRIESTETVSIGDHNVPADIAEMLDAEIVP
jgi:putative phage-type endonuclease